MPSYSAIDMENWPRKALFDFYCAFDNPCYNITVHLAAQSLFSFAKKQKESVFLLALYAILRACNSVPQMRQRIIDGKPVNCERIAAMTPIMTEHELLNQLWCEYQPDFTSFAHELGPKLAAARRGVASLPEQYSEDFICASCVPWMHFSALTQAEYFFGQSVPILAWGKMQGGLVPIACKAHHAFVDGLHISRFFAHIEQSFANPESLYTT